jgi:drug/metabolite transporter superfamily protein YnfA
VNGCDNAHARGEVIGMVLLKSIALFAIAALLEIGGAWLVLAGSARTPRSALGRRRDHRPIVCLAGVGVIMYAPR